jgi:glycerol uptake facilitator-like aquaporin
MKVDAYIGEFLGTLALVLSILVFNGNALYITAAFGAIIYTLGKLSGGHINPAVSAAMVLKGQLGWNQLAFYVFAQVSGALTSVYLYKLYAK